MKKSIVLVLALFAASFGAALKLSPSATETPLTSTNAYTALKWSFGGSGRKFAQDDTLLFVSDSANAGYIQTRDVGPKARNQQGVNYYLPDSMKICIEAARVDADTNTTLVTFQASVNGGNFFSLPAIPTTTDLGITGRALYCASRVFIPGLYIKPRMFTTTATDTNVVYSAIFFTK
jgi:hypothetical protein